jgi:hypothetical protein
MVLYLLVGDQQGRGYSSWSLRNKTVLYLSDTLPLIIHIWSLPLDE